VDRRAREAGELDETPELIRLAKLIERSVIETIESGTMTKDLASIADPRPAGFASTRGFLEAIADKLHAKIENGAVAR